MNDYHLNYVDRQYMDVVNSILKNGSLDYSPRPVWGDGAKAHSLSINHVVCRYDLSKNQWPLITLRHIAYKSAIKELLWIYQEQSNSLELLSDKYGINWWDSWNIGDGTIGSCYGETVHKHDLMNKFLMGLKQDPDGRRHIINLWQNDDFNEKHGLKPCAFLTIWNVRHANDGDYLDMMLIQRSSDFITAGSINQFQYAVFLKLIASSLGYKAGMFTWVGANVQIYDRHMMAAYQLQHRSSVCGTDIRVEIPKLDFYDYTSSDIVVTGYDSGKINEENPQIKLEVAV